MICWYNDANVDKLLYCNMLAIDIVASGLTYMGVAFNA